MGVFSVREVVRVLPRPVAAAESKHHSLDASLSLRSFLLLLLLPHPARTDE